MATFDIILLVLLVFAVISGFYKGLVTQVVSLSSIVVGLLIASRFAPDLTKVAMAQFGSEEKVTYILCFVAIFLVCALVMALVGVLVTKVIKIATLSWLNRSLGGVFAFFAATLVLGLLISAFEGLNESWNFIDPSKYADLKVYPRLRDFAMHLFPQIKMFFAKYVTPEVCLPPLYY